MAQKTSISDNTPIQMTAAVLIILGFGYFAFQLQNQPPAQAWGAYLVNVLLWSAIAQGGLLFSMVMHMTKARWSQPLQGLSESPTVP